MDLWIVDEKRARARMKEMVARLSLPEEKEERIRAIDAITPSFSSHVRIGHKRDTRASIRSPFPGKLFHFFALEPRGIPRRPIVRSKIPICPAPSTLPTYSEASLRHSGVFWNSKDPPVHARAYPVTRYQASTEEDGRINPIKRTTVDRFVVDFVNSIIAVSKRQRPTAFDWPISSTDA